MNKPDIKEPFIIVGKIGASFGVKGWAKVQSYTEAPADILTFSPLYLKAKDGSYQPIALEAGKEQPKQIIIKIAGYDNPEVVKELTGQHIYINRSQLPELESDEYYWSDLEGLTVINQHGDNIGKVHHILSTGSNDVLIVHGEKHQAIPYLKDQVVKKVDLEKGEIHVDWEEL